MVFSSVSQAGWYPHPKDRRSIAREGVAVSLVRIVKNAVVPAGSGPRTVQTGAFRGVRLNLDLRTQSQWYVGLFEREVYPWLARLSQGAQTAVDIGAAGGEYTLYFLMKTAAARVIAFEPDPKSFESLRGNLRLNGLEDAGRLELCPKF